MTLSLTNLILALVAAMLVGAAVTLIVLRAYVAEGRTAWAETKRWANDTSEALSWTREFPAVTACVPEPAPEPTGRHSRLILDPAELDEQFAALIKDVDLGVESGRHRKAEVAQ